MANQNETEQINSIRLQKYMADCGIGSRRKCEEWITQGLVQVNGEIITQLGTKVIIGQDVVTYQGKEIQPVSDLVYILLNKPIGYVTTVKDPFARDTILDLVKVKQRIVPVGRLDMYTSGAILLSNDGHFVYQVTHPKHEIEKTYTVTLKGTITPQEIEMLRQGVDIGDYQTRPAKVKILKIDKEKQQSRLAITIHEGKNRQIRRMCEAIEKKVLALHRRAIGQLTVKDIPLGKWRYLSQAEVKKCLHTIAGKNKQ